MDILIEKLHTAARRYCMDRYNYWQEKYTLLANDGRCADVYRYSDEALNIFPRYNLLKAVLIEIERFTPQDISSLIEARELIGYAGSITNSMGAKNTKTSIETRAVEEERNKFNDFIHSISLDELLEIEPLFFRRVISKIESQHLWAEIVEIWGIDKPHGVMYPNNDNNPKNAVFLEEDRFKKEVGTKILHSVLTGRGIKRIWELSEFGEDEYELETNVFEPYYDGAERYWFTSEMDWIIYASHEKTITFNGWIIDAVQKVLQSHDFRV
jgi:hypothetical protein